MRPGTPVMLPTCLARQWASTLTLQPRAPASRTHNSGMPLPLPPDTTFERTLGTAQPTTAVAPPAAPARSTLMGQVNRGIYELRNGPGSYATLEKFVAEFRSFAAQAAEPKPAMWTRPEPGAHKPIKNVLFVLLDELRTPPPHWWRSGAFRYYVETLCPNLVKLYRDGASFPHTKTASTACTPARAAIQSSQGPKKTGVENTSGLAKGEHDPAMVYLDPSFATIGHWLRAAGFDEVRWGGKWHSSLADLDAADGTPISCWDTEGNEIPSHTERYREANTLRPYGYDGYKGCEPHGPDMWNMGVMRDPGYVHDACKVIEGVAAQDKPFALTVSLTQPHDIAVWVRVMVDVGVETLQEVFANLPEPPLDPTRREDPTLLPETVRDFIKVFKRTMVWPAQYDRLFSDDKLHALFYLYCTWHADQSVGRIMAQLEASGLLDTTLVALSADHGTMLGSHGGMQQKWHNGYEKSTTVPTSFHHPSIPSQRRTEFLSHLDFLPTFLGLLGKTTSELKDSLRNVMRESGIEWNGVMPQGRNLAEVVRGGPLKGPNEAYFYTGDEITKGQSQYAVFVNTLPAGFHYFGKKLLAYEALKGRTHVEAYWQGCDDDPEYFWKLVRFFDPTGELPDELQLFRLHRDPELADVRSEAGDTNLIGISNYARRTQLMLDRMADKRVASAA